MATHLHAATAPKYTSGEAIPEITGKEGSQTKIKKSNHTVWQSNWKYSVRSKERWGKFEYLRQGTSRPKDHAA